MQNEIVMNFALKNIIAYCEAHTTPQSNVLHELERETNLKTLAPQMLSGHLQGQFLSFISQMIQAKSILEIGTFTGYSAIALAKGLTAEGTLHTIEANEELAHISEKYIRKAGLEKKIHRYIGDAKKLIPAMNLQFDLVFIDAGKNDYALYYDLVFDKLKPGGYILADNVLWSGKVIQEKKDKDTRTIDDFNKKIQQDERVENILLPIRDGLILVRKRN